MINPQNTIDLASNLEDILERDVVRFELDVLKEKERNEIAHLIYRWTQGDEVKQRIENINFLSPTMYVIPSISISVPKGIVLSLVAT